MIFRVEENGRSYTAKGVISWKIQVGDLVELEGDWKKSDFTGEDEFSFRFACMTIPEDPRSLLTYAVSLTLGLGVELEKKIWEKYGDKWQQALTLEIKGIRETTAFHWLQTLERIKNQKNQADAIGFLLSKKCTLNMANVAWERWEEETYMTINQNPYALADLPNYGFADIDGAIRLAFGIDDHDSRRINSAILYVINRLSETGSTLADKMEVEEQTRKLLKMEIDFSENINKLVNVEELKMVTRNKIATKNNYDNEAVIQNWFAAVWVKI
jgi:exodeoxyribonuclease V alpha subunit